MRLRPVISYRYDAAKRKGTTGLNRLHAGGPLLFHAVRKNRARPLPQAVLTKTADAIMIAPAVLLATTYSLLT
jgi:hypothetical protein